MSKSPLMPFTEALATIQSNSQCLVKEDTIALNKSLGRVLAQDIYASIDIPPAANSAMDGYVMRFDDWQANKVFPISQRIPAGVAPEQLQENTVARIFTGAEIPANADLVIMQENAITHDEGVSFTQVPKQNDNIRPQGQDVLKDSRVLEKGLRLDAQHLGIIASLGINQIAVFDKLKVGVLTTGDELITAGNTLNKGQIFNSNGPMLQALVEKLGHEVASYQHASDNHQETESILAKMSSCCDIILSSGGVSVGEEDHVKNVIEANGELLLWKIAIKPGKPLVHGSV
ncbi:molybdopterin molybdenumtransferase MoeA, partial [Marinomonas sp. 42_23_T18]